MACRLFYVMDFFFFFGFIVMYTHNRGRFSIAIEIHIWIRLMIGVERITIRKREKMKICIEVRNTQRNDFEFPVIQQKFHCIDKSCKSFN